MQQITKEVLAILEGNESFSGLDQGLKDLILEQIEKLSEVDPLTKVSNRIKMLGIVESEWARSVRYHSPVSVIMLDVDGFKSINETHGHDVGGDEVLQTIAHLVERNIRATDTISRWGGMMNS